jgi:hypothetical protein
MKTAYYYLAVEPLVEKYEDTPEIRPIISIPVQTTSKTFEISFFALDNQLHMIRVSVPNLVEERISDEDAKAQAHYLPIRNRSTKALSSEQAQGWTRRFYEANCFAEHVCANRKNSKSTDRAT